MGSDYPNILWIVLDTLREDYAEPIWEVLKKYGFVKYENVIAPAPWTIPSHISMFTGEYPSVHGVFEPQIAYSESIESKIYPPKIKRVSKITLFNDLPDFNRILISANQWISPNMGLVMFDHYYNILPIVPPFNIKYRLFLPFNWIVNKISRDILSKLKRWPLNKGITNYLKIFMSMVNKNDLKETSNFVFVNLMETHEPYRRLNFSKLRLNNLKQNTPLSESVITILQKEYSLEVLYLSRKLDKFLEWLNKKELIDKFIIIITSDHGQLLGEHNRLGHGVFLYDELIQVPLYIRVPSNSIKSHSNVGFQKWLSLRSLYFVLKEFIATGDLTILSKYEDVIYSEVFGPGYVGKIQTEQERRNIEQLEKHRIAVYHGPYKGIYNVDDRILECVKSYDGSEITEEVKDMLIKDVKKFLRGARLKTAVRRVNLKGKI